MPNNPDAGLYHAGMRLPFFGGKGGAKILSKRDMNRLVKLLNAFANMQVLVKTSDNATNYGTLTVSELNTVLEIAIAPGATTTGGGSSFGGVWNATVAYAPGTIVVTRQTVMCPDQSNPPTPLPAGSVEWTKWGSWIAARATAIGEAPVWPEPNNPAWMMLAIGAGNYQTISGCDAAGNTEVFLTVAGASCNAS